MTMTVKRAVYPGTFDPITKGHEDPGGPASRPFAGVGAEVAPRPGAESAALEAV